MIGLLPSVSMIWRVERLDDRHDVLALDEGHLQVELGELRLAVGAQVFVAEAAGDLEVALEAGDHQAAA